MIFQNLIPTVMGIFIGLYSVAHGQSTAADSCASKIPPVRQVPADSAPGGAGKQVFWKNIQVTGGQLTLPFKIRPKADTRTFRLTTDVTVGAYIGCTKKLAAGKDYFLTVPLAAGLTFININDSNTSFDLDLKEAEVVPGLSWCTGLILQLGSYNFGLMFGKDYASEVGQQWEYHRRLWWSFGIGFTFFH